MQKFLNKATYAFVFVALLSACSRPYATLQRTPGDLTKTSVSTISPITDDLSSSDVSQAVKAQPAIVAVQEDVSPTVKEAIAQSEALVSSNTKLTNAEKHTLTKRMNRIKRVLATTPLVSENAAPTHKTTALERMVARKINKQIQHKLSPQQPQLNVGVLSTGAVLVLIGLLLVLLTSGTAATLGLVALIVGAVLLLVGLL